MRVLKFKNFRPKSNQIELRKLIFVDFAEDVIHVRIKSNTLSYATIDRNYFQEIVQTILKIKPFIM